MSSDFDCAARSATHNDDAGNDEQRAFHGQLQADLKVGTTYMTTDLQDYVVPAFRPAYCQYDRMNPNSSNRVKSKLALMNTSPQLFFSHATRFIWTGRKNPSQLKNAAFTA